MDPSFAMADVAESLARLDDMAHQVGGHAGAKGGIKALAGKVYKPFQSGRRGEREHEFYELVADAVKNESHQDGGGSVSLLAGLEPLIPRYFGVLETTNEATRQLQKFLVLEDLTFGRKWPCVMDVKVGTRSFEDNASPEKIAYEMSKFPLQEQAGFRLQGIKVFDPSTQTYIEYDKHFGRAILTMNALSPAVGRFLPSEDIEKRRFLIQAFLARLTEFQTWFDQQQEAEFIASSLLFLYSGEPSSTSILSKDKLQVSDAELSTAFTPDIRLIDFAHVSHPAPPRRDDGVRTGIKTLIECFQQLLNDMK